MMNLEDQVKALKEKSSAAPSFLGDSKLIESYQELIDKGLVKPRGYSLQTIDEKHLDIPNVASSYNTKK